MSEKKRMCGRLSCKFIQLTKTTLVSKGDVKLLTHDEAIAEINRWFTYSYSKTNIGIETKYPYVYKSTKEIKHHIDEYKVLILPSLEYYSKETVSSFKNIIVKDLNAEYYELCPLFRTKLLAKDVMASLEKYMNLGNDLMRVGGCVIDDAISPIIPSDNVTFSYIPNPKIYEDMKDFISQRINANVHTMHSLKNINMRGNQKLLGMFQSRQSVIRQSLPRKFSAFRGQILLRPELTPKQVIFPYTWQQDLCIYAKKYVDITSPHKIDPACFIKSDMLRVGQKRDPAINLNAYSFYDEIAFAKSDNIYIGPGEIGHKNADFDGDTQISIPFRDPLEILEIDTNVLPEHNLRSFMSCRVSFTESQILAMHQRPMPSSYKYSALYDFIRLHETHVWKTNIINIETMTRLEKMYPHVDFARFIEPTKVILENTISTIAQCNGSKEAYDFFNFINTKTLELANGMRNELYAPHLPSEYLMGDDLLCESIIRTCMSGAKGSINTIITLTSTLNENDGTTKITNNIAPLKRDGLFEKLDSTSATMALSSKRVQTNGHAFFKSNISYDLISFDGGKLCYQGIPICNHLDFLVPRLLINPLISLKILNNK